ncbi:large ribosomal subunit protein mL42 isoform X1 [Pleurodeles waltl]|uniref:large ribosomal subunit protein mL42 isoform X1 n=1 Tax=Pleurodeles waltl TaxID=8319 RepID=UPI003709A18F
MTRRVSVMTLSGSGRAGLPLLRVSVESQCQNSILRQDGRATLHAPQAAVLSPASQKSTYSALPEDSNCKVELARTSDNRTIVCYHPTVDIPFEHTKPIPRPDPVHSLEETHELVLKARLDQEVTENKQGPTIEQLSKMFYTTKHRWYPVGQYRRRRIKTNPPKDR